MAESRAQGARRDHRSPGVAREGPSGGVLNREASNASASLTIHRRDAAAAAPTAAIGATP
eukprot:CAMPEP_0206008052 /NCGR_PEP_ID=MMETSP1464-20131121/6703_1 /ASSEMBLY_ACC=CAM_ASM_001124 /TAXON_ID=119497 /ORGANISM="Exanthemachrysis gayraliae, Strain RCC1523" /LENGTH=59 /DNA_ID=CAMNT_0053381579 /DNA_START=366 /DNA_END=543 /DNA_ORIENTATION=+